MLYLLKNSKQPYKDSNFPKLSLSLSTSSFESNSDLDISLQSSSISAKELIIEISPDL